MDEHERADARSTPSAPPPDRRASPGALERANHPHTADAVATLSVLLVLGAATAFLAWPRSVDDESKCRALFDRWTELRIRQAEPSVAGAELEHRKESARSTAARGDAYARCVQHADRDALLCSERAHSIDELERCFP